MSIRLPPSARASIESLRAFDYSFASALADLVDNSITAKAKNIRIDLEWDGPNSRLIIKDDGVGMDDQPVNDESLFQRAMKFGSKSPKEERDADDFGRFGLGLKTASIWACRKVTVLSKVSGRGVSSYCWDVDHVSSSDEWYLLRGAGPRVEELEADLGTMPSGTIVLWEGMDTLLKGGADGMDKTEESVRSSLFAALQHLGMVFHRLIESGQVKIRCGITPIQPWDPLGSQPEPDFVPVEKFSYRGEEIAIRCAVMPHPKRMSQAEQARVGGLNGLAGQQGIYVYRRGRIIVAGGWMGLFKPADHFKLARIAIDVPNSLDLAVGISVTKTNVALPDGICSRLSAAAEATRSRAYEVYRYRGKRQLPTASPSGPEFVWKKEAVTDTGVVKFIINRDHPLYAKVAKGCEDKKALRLLVELMEQTLPVAEISLVNSEKPDSIAGPFEGMTDEQIADKFREAIEVFAKINGTRQQAKESLLGLYPYSHYPEILKNI
jgi:hypothetical protein